ncbi:hypothetical protein KC19_1G199400 [Ceratodon purpureus]|uniref:Uncharacterized protein n=1 Tax=Ceratodon purpureus TaxID=3225 RepID=A0A8T0J775_CERPU|nr:hypothetical protein KC19_1G199400 [Ceratodon purpureus]
MSLFLILRHGVACGSATGSHRDDAEPTIIVMGTYNLMLCSVCHGGQFSHPLWVGPRCRDRR